MSESVAIAQRSIDKQFFDHKDMDYYFSWVVGREVYEGSDRTECFRAAARITDGDPASWQAEWARLADEVEAAARHALENGDREAARKTFLRACTYHRAPLFIMGADDLRFRPLVQKMKDCFRAAAELFDPPIEDIQVPFHGKQLPGLVWKADMRGEKRPTLIVIGGMETFVEDCYFYTGQTGPQRGYHLIAVDLPGQGLNPDQGLYLEAKMEHPLRAVVDYCHSRPEFDLQRLALFGFSWGGHIVFKGARFEPRIKALIANPAMPDLFRAALAQQSGHNRNDPVNKTAFQQITWRFGLKISPNPGDIARRFGKAFDYLFYGKVNPAEISIPVLCIAGEGEAGITLKIARETFEKLPNPQSRLVIYTRAEGGAAHCQVDNLPLPNRLIFDWLDEVL